MTTINSILDKVRVVTITNNTMAVIGRETAIRIDEGGARKRKEKSSKLEEVWASR